MRVMATSVAPGAKTQEEELLRQQMMEAAMLADLGLARREQISTEEDRKAAKGVAASKSVDVTRLSSQIGTMEYHVARQNQSATARWNAAYQNMERDEEAEMLEDLGQGQSHRAALAQSLKGHHEPRVTARGGQMRGTGRGGGVMGTRGRGGGNASQIANAGHSSSVPTPNSFGSQDARASVDTGSQARGSRHSVSMPRHTATVSVKGPHQGAVGMTRTGKASSRGTSNMGGRGRRQQSSRAPSNRSATTVPKTQTGSKPAVHPTGSRPAPHVNYESLLISGQAFIQARGIAFGKPAGSNASPTPAISAKDSTPAQENHETPSSSKPGTPAQSSHEKPPSTKIDTLAQSIHAMPPSFKPNPSTANPMQAISAKPSIPTVVEPQMQQISESGTRPRSAFGVSTNLERLQSTCSSPLQARTNSSLASNASVSKKADNFLSLDQTPAVPQLLVSTTAEVALSPQRQSNLSDLLGLEFSETVKLIEDSPDVANERDINSKPDPTRVDTKESDKTEETAVIEAETSSKHSENDKHIVIQGNDLDVMAATLFPNIINLPSTNRLEKLRRLQMLIDREIEGQQGVSARLAEHVQPPSIISHLESRGMFKPRAVLETKRQHASLEAPVPQLDAITPPVPLSGSIHAISSPVPLSRGKGLQRLNSANPADWAGHYAPGAQDDIIGDSRNIYARKNTSSTSHSTSIVTSFPDVGLGTMQSRHAPRGPPFTSPAPTGLELKSIETNLPSSASMHAPTKPTVNRSQASGTSTIGSHGASFVRSPDPVPTTDLASLPRTATASAASSASRMRANPHPSVNLSEASSGGQNQPALRGNTYASKYADTFVPVKEPSKPVAQQPSTQLMAMPDQVKKEAASRTADKKRRVENKAATEPQGFW